ncbi:MAG: DHH family phosphoesterase [Bacteroidales bacterium]|nr:DHH family phosphoesterase [Bacteroidales bacterium]
MEILTEKQIASFRAAVSQCRKAAVVVHTHPDGDAIGSGLAMKNYLLSKGRQAELVYPDGFPSTLAFLTEGESLIDAETDKAAAERAIGGCDTLFVLDMNAFRRAEELAPVLAACPAGLKVLIDHHLNPAVEEFDLVFSKADISSASELLFWMLLGAEGGDISAIPDKARYALMTGMTTDTNNFANSVYPSTLEMASLLLASGVDRNDIVSKLYQSYSAMRIFAFAAMLYSRLQILPGGVACMVSDEAFQTAFPLAEGETEGLVNIPLGIGEVRMSIYARWNGDHFRVSVRSKKGCSANALVSQYFHGGGHELAAGGKIFVPADIPSQAEAKDFIASCVAQFLQTENH